MVAQSKMASSEKRKAAHKRNHQTKHAAKNNNNNNSSMDSSEKSNSNKTISTRLCLKSIPASFSSNQLRDYLIKEYQRRSSGSSLVITDCRVLTHPQKKTSRRIAFCGVQSAEMAQNVVRLFHQTFCLTSRITVELAHDRKREEKSSTTTSTTATAKPKETVQNTKKENDAKSMLIAASGSSKAKFWSNDLDISDGALAKNELPASEKSQEKVGEEEEEEEENDDDDASSSGSSSASDSSDDEADPLVKSTSTQEKKNKNKMSDLDFLKSKQKMVDNLGEEEENSEEKKQKDGNNKDAETESSSSDSDSDDSSTTSASEASQANQQLSSDMEENKNLGKVKSEEDHQEEEEEEEEDNTTASDRLFVRNLPFTTTEEELEEHFAVFGSVKECHIPVDDRKNSKGFGFVAFDSRQDAARALDNTDGSDFQGRFLHVLPSRQKPQPKKEESNRDDDRPLSYKERQELIRRKEAGTKSSQGWSASFVRGDAVVDSLADRLGIKKGDILNVKEGLNSGDAAVRLALAETQVIEENRSYFQDHGIDMEALVSFNNSKSKEGSAKRSTTCLLVKNLPYDTTIEELNKVFHGVGDEPTRILLPPSRTIAMVEYGHGSDAKRAFRKLAYRRFKSVPLYLEWAPMQAIEARPAKNDNEKVKEEEPMDSTTEEEHALEGPTPSIYVKNLNFSTTEEKLKKFFDKAVGNVRAVRIPTKQAPVKKTRVGTTQGDEMQTLSMGFGFVEFATQESARKALSKMQGSLVDGYALELKASTKSLTQQTVKVPASKKNPTKITVRNVPFQATRTEILKLFGSFGQLKRVRLPKKFNGGHRGFAFVEFVTHKEALAAMKSLSRTHLYGRHLVLEWAEEDAVGAEGLDSLRQKAQRDVMADSKKATGKKRQKLS